jgi:hypothetical protein
MAQARTNQRVPLLTTSSSVASRRSTAWVVPSPWQRPSLWAANPPEWLQKEEGKLGHWHP